jgi:2-C-methyl-D-erythritol 4-phosphate cytidylyltransferase
MAAPQKNHLILVAGGTGTRMMQHLPKQFLQLLGEPVIVHTLRQFRRFDPHMNIVVVMHPDYVEYWNHLRETLGLDIPHTAVPGGRERFHSVKAGLDSIADLQGIVGIHDAVRPLASIATIRNAYDAAASGGAAVPVIPVNESLRQMTGATSMALNRSLFRLVQTPQCFSIALLKEAFQQEYIPEFTDDASVMEAAGHNIQLVEGNRENIKLTTPEDLIMAEALIRSWNDSAS